MSRQEAQNFILTKNEQQVSRGYTLCAVELKSTNTLNYIDWNSHFTPAVGIDGA